VLDELDACQRASKNEPSEGVFRGGQLDKIEAGGRANRISPTYCCRLSFAATILRARGTRTWQPVAWFSARGSFTMWPDQNSGRVPTFPKI
jgi:hypothetical protein